MSFMRKILDALKMESTREMENGANGFVPDAQTIYFANGKMYKVCAVISAFVTVAQSGEKCKISTKWEYILH